MLFAVKNQRIFNMLLIVKNVNTNLPLRDCLPLYRFNIEPLIGSK